ncbi:MAG: PQQ-dependent sugar dehydrogenase [Pseudomonadota bacterium]
MRKSARNVLGLFVQAAALLLVACGGIGGTQESGAPLPPAPDTTAPTVPAGVTVAPQSPTSILVSWTASNDAGTGVAGYLVYRGASATAIATVTTTNYTDTSLAANTNYSYTVRAFDGATPRNESALSAAANATTPPTPVADSTPPSVPAGVTAVAQSATQVLVSWNASTDATGIGGYHVFRNGGGTAIATVTSTNYTDSGLVASTAYTYTVSAFDTVTPANESAVSGAVSATTGTAPVGGLDARPANATCLAGDPPSTTIAITWQRVFPSLPLFTQPVAMMQAPGNSARWYVVQKTGSVRVFDNTPNVSTTSEFINLAARLNSSPGDATDERGLLGMAFHPDYPTDPRVFFYYTANNPGLVDRVSQFSLNAGGTALDPASEIVLFNVTDPESNHNGGNIAFGPDGFLYIGIGDGGGANDAHGAIGNGQLLTTLLGKMLRIDVSATTASNTYAIPPTNPYVANPRCNVGGTGAASCPEIFAYGFRNPWRWSFDRGSGELWLNDVGQNTLEEIDKVTIGGNYGWRCREGTNTFSGTCGPNPNPIAPVAQYGRSQGFSTTGGFVYRGSTIPNLHGRYVFGDFGGGLWNISRATVPTVTLGAGLATGLAISSFGQDTDGEVYIVDLGGTLNKIVPGTGGGRAIPNALSQTGCVNPANPTQPATGLIPYAPNAPFFSDGANKARWLALPDSGRINVTASNDFDFPNGSVLVKNFSLGSRLVETRLFMRHNNGEWAGYTYEWNAGGTEAMRVVGGKTVTVAGQTWQFPSEAQCLQCHSVAAGRTLGPEIGQLNGDFGYPTGRTANQLTTLNAIDTLTPALAQAAAQLPVIPNPFGSAALGERARAYLHSNCSYCHQPGGPAPTDLDFRYTTALAAMNACDITPDRGDLGITDPRRIAPGSAARSVVVARVNRTGADAMPPLMRHTIDTAGVQLLTDWVNGLANCN